MQTTSGPSVPFAVASESEAMTRPTVLERLLRPRNVKASSAIDSLVIDRGSLDGKVFN